QEPLDGTELAWVVERLPTAAFVLGPGPVVRYANRAGQRLAHAFGGRVRTGQRLFDVGTDPSLAALAEQLLARRVLVDRKLTTEDGRTLEVQGVGDKDGRIAVLMAEETTARERRAQAEGDFLVNAAHEFLSPLTSIAAAVHVLEDGAGEDPALRA